MFYIKVYIQSSNNKDLTNEYEVTAKGVEHLVSTIREKKTGSYSIFGLAKSGNLYLIDEKYKDSKQLNVYVTKYLKEGFKVYYTRGGA